MTTANATTKRQHKHFYAMGINIPGYWAFDKKDERDAWVIRTPGSSAISSKWIVKTWVQQQHWY